MISFASFPAQSDYDTRYGSARHHPDVAEDVFMDLDAGEDFETGEHKLTCPGEFITSSQAYMRYVSRMSLL